MESKDEPRGPDAQPSDPARFNLLLDGLLRFGASNDRDSLLTEFASQMSWVLDFQQCWFGLREPDQTTSYHPALPQTTDAAKGISASQREMLEQVIRDRAIRFAEATADAPPTMALPLCVEERAIGGLLLHSRHASGFDRNDIRFAQVAAAFLAMSLDRIQRRDSLARSHEDARRHSEKMYEQAVLLEEQRQTAVELAEELRKADLAKSEFLANMSHEIRTPMNAIMGLTEIVLGTELSDTQHDYLSIVMQSAESLLAVVNDILDFSKIEAGMLTLEEVQFQLSDTVFDTIRAQALRAHNKEIELACFIDPSIPDTLLGDPGRLRQILMNLVGNAIKFTEAGEVIVRVIPTTASEGACAETIGNEANGLDGHPAPDRGSKHITLTFSVSDTGIGIPSDKLESIFQPFEQADKSTTRDFGGTGLGLAICQKLASVMGNGVEVESQIGTGSQFRFTADLIVSDRQSNEIRIPKEMKGMRVLIVDDNATNRIILEQTLLTKTMAPTTASLAKDGFRCLKEAIREGDPFELLISDVHMPSIDGFGFVEMIRADPDLKDLKIIMLTSAGHPGDLRRCEDLGVNAHLTKPVKQSAFYNMVLRVLGHREDGHPGKSGWRAVRHSDAVRLPPLRILLVEDSSPNQKVALAILSGSGHKVVLANHGEEALEILARQEFDVILMDVQMPVMDGLEATAAIRASEAGTDRHQAIVAMTAHSMSGDRQRCLEGGMDGYVSKPVNRDHLFRTISKAVGCDILANSDCESEASVEEKIVDWSGPLRQLKGDHAILRDITESYIKESVENMAELEGAIASGDAKAARRFAHTLKGAMRFFGAQKAQQIGQEIEEAAAGGNLNLKPEPLLMFKMEVVRVVRVLQRFVDSGEM